MAADVYQLQTVSETAGEYGECIPAWQGSKTNSTTPLADAAALITAWISTIQPLWLAVCAADYALAGVKARRVNNGGGPTSTTVAAPGTVGTFSIATSCPQQTAQLLIGSYHQTAPARWRSGRIFIPSIPEDGYTAPGYTAPLQTAQNALLAGLVVPLGGTPAGPFTLGVWSGKYQTFFSAEWDVSLLVGTIRKRLHPAL